MGDAVSRHTSFFGKSQMSLFSEWRTRCRFSCQSRVSIKYLSLGRTVPGTSVGLKGSRVPSWYTALN